MLKKTEYNVQDRITKSESFVFSDEDIELYNSAKQWFHDNDIPVSQFAWFTAFAFDWGDWFSPNYDDETPDWYELIDGEYYYKDKSK